MTSNKGKGYFMNYKDAIINLINQIDDSDERFLKQIYIIIRNHIKTK